MSEFDPKTIETIVTSGGVTGIVVTVAAILRKVWRDISRERVDTRVDTATRDLIDSMSKELDRVAKEINEIKAHHEAEKKALFQKIRQLQDSMDMIKAKNESMKAAALDVYAYLVTNTKDFDPEVTKEIKDRIFSIAFSGNDHN